MRKALLVALVLVVLVALLAGCLGGPSQRSDQAVTPDTTTAATLKDIQAQVVSLAQQNSVTINAIQKSQQNTDAQIAKVAGDVGEIKKINAALQTDIGGVKAGVANISQNSFRLESWLAESTGGWRVHLFGVDTYDPIVPSDDPDRQVGTAERGVGGVHSPVRDAGSGLPGRAGADARRALPDSQGSDSAPVKGGEKMAWYWIIIAFILGAFMVNFLDAVKPLVAARIAAGKAGLFDHLAAFAIGINQAIDWVIESILGDKPKTGT